MAKMAHCIIDQSNWSVTFNLMLMTHAFYASVPGSRPYSARTITGHCPFSTKLTALTGGFLL